MSASAPPETAEQLASYPQYLRVPGDPDREYYAFVPAGSEGATPLVVVHGISRNGAELVTRFAPLAERFGVPLIAPIFRKKSYGMYQQVLDARRGLRADLALFDILNDASARLGLNGERLLLFGFSGGGQFAHRFTFLHPHRVSACIPVSAGWYTWPDEAIGWPFGLGEAPVEPIDAGAIADVRFHLIVGERDNQDDDSALRHDPELDRLQGLNRVERAGRWRDAMIRSGLNPGCSLTMLPNARHSFNSSRRRGLLPLVFTLLGFPADQPGDQ